MVDWRGQWIEAINSFPILGQGSILQCNSTNMHSWHCNLTANGVIDIHVYTLCIWHWAWLASKMALVWKIRGFEYLKLKNVAILVTLSIKYSNYMMSSSFYATSLVILTLWSLVNSRVGQVVQWNLCFVICKCSSNFSLFLCYAHYRHAV